NLLFGDRMKSLRLGRADAILQVLICLSVLFVLAHSAAAKIQWDAPGQADGNVAGYLLGITNANDDGTIDYDLELPFRFGVAASWSAFNWTFAGDILYSDWTQAKYADLPIAKGSSPENQPYYRTLFDRYFQKRYRPTTDLRLGLEFLVPLVSIAVRGGYALHPDPYIGPGIVSKLTVSTSKERQMWTVGFGRLFDQVLMLDIAVTWESHTTRTGPVLSEDSRRRVFANMAYRF
ncbi:MAG: hypothetical protein QGH20_05350, partial [Candidatus Latescibacteria bacterium]|nr:hypothetical protein [Candidatus Latescibacterota bacterium]